MGHLAPDANERLSALITEHYVKQGVPTEHSSNALHEPIDKGTDVDGVLRARIAAEDAQNQSEIDRLKEK